jgi:hypothetical protein
MICPVASSKQLKRINFFIFFSPWLLFLRSLIYSSILFISFQRFFAQIFNKRGIDPAGMRIAAVTTKEQILSIRRNGR